MSTPPATYPLATIAKLFELSERRVQQLAKEGVIPRAERGRYELVPAVQGYIRYLKARTLSYDAADLETDHKARLTKAQADKAELELGQLRAELMTVEQYDEAVTDAYQRVAQRLKTIAPRLSPSIIGLKTLPEARKVLNAEIRELMEELHGKNGEH